jgi:hypothetical protein
MHAATEPAARPVRVRPGVTGRVEVWWRVPAGRGPDVLEIGVHGKRRPRVEAYWDGCRIAL